MNRGWVEPWSARETRVGLGGPVRSGPDKAHSENCGVRWFAPRGCPRSDGAGMCGARLPRAAVRRVEAGRARSARAHPPRRSGGRPGSPWLSGGVWKRPPSIGGVISRNAHVQTGVEFLEAAAVGPERQGRGGQFEVLEDLLDDDRVGQEGEHDHGEVAPGAGESVHVEDALEQAGPGQAPGSAGSWRGRQSCPQSGQRRAGPPVQGSPGRVTGCREFLAGGGYLGAPRGAETASARRSEAVPREHFPADE